MAEVIPETIFVQTDPAFEIAFLARGELTKNARLKVKHFQTASITNIESNDDSDDRRMIFGGDVESLDYSAFGRTASAVVRMCMLEVAGVKRSLWPVVGKNTARRNKEKLKLENKNGEGNIAPPPLANTKPKAREYWCKYDQLYPHFLIENEVRKVGIDNTASIPRVMMIFRDNFTELIEITTKFTAKAKGDQEFESFVHVSYIVHEIEPGEDSKNVAQLKAFMSPVKIPKEYFERVFNAKNETDLENLHHLLDAMQLKTEEDKH